MSIRFRKSFKVAPGVKFNLGKKSAGVTLGNKYFRKTYSTSGRKTTSSSIPGTGITFMNTSTKKKKGKKSKRKNDEVEVVNRQPEPVLEETTVNEVGLGASEPEPRKPKLWPWIAMALVLLCGLGFLLGHGGNTPEVSDEVGTSTVEATTQFSYSANNVELKMLNGVLTAFVGDKQVPYTGLVDAADGTYIVKDGVADTGYNGVYGNDESLRLVKDGKLDTTSTGIVAAGNGAWYLAQNGAVRTDYTGVQKNQFGRWYVKDGQVDFGYNGVASSDGSTYLVKEGKVDTSQNGVMQVGDRWAFVTNGMVAQNYTGVQSNEYGTWYINNGYVDFARQGTVSAPDGNTYNVANGRASIVTTRPATTAVPSYDSSEEEEYTGYIGNKNSYKFHYPTCRDVAKMSDSNKVTGHPRSWYIERGYTPCGHCYP